MPIVSALALILTTAIEVCDVDGVPTYTDRAEICDYQGEPIVLDQGTFSLVDAYVPPVDTSSDVPDHDVLVIERVVERYVPVVINVAPTQYVRTYPVFSNRRSDRDQNRRNSASISQQGHGPMSSHAGFNSMPPQPQRRKSARAPGNPRGRAQPWQ